MRSAILIFFVLIFLSVPAVSAAEYSDYYIQGGAVVTNETGLQYQITRGDNTTSVKWNKSVTTDGAVGIQKYTVLVQSDQAENYTLYALNKYTGEDRWNMSLDRPYTRLQFLGGKYAVLLTPDKFIQVNLYSHEIVCGKTFESAANQYYGLIKSQKNGNYYVMTITDGTYKFFKLITEESSNIFACDLKISRYTQNSGTVTIKNTGNKNSPTDGFDVLLYFKRFDGSVYLSVYHATDVIAPGYSESFINAFSGAEDILYGVIRVNPYRKFLEQDYDNNKRTFSLIEKEILSYTATEQARYNDNRGWDYNYYTCAWMDGESITVSNGGYEPLLSTNPIATGYNIWNKRQGYWYWVSDDLYVDAVEISYDYGDEKYRTDYVTVSGVVPNSHMHVYVDCGYYKELSYNAEKGIWEAYICISNSKLRDEFLVRIYSDSPEPATDDIVNFVSNVEVHSYYTKNSWTWNY